MFLKLILRQLQKLLINYDHFYPAYKAGGPIQSLTNLVISFQKEYEIGVITSGYDLNADHPLDKIKINAWSEVTLPHGPSAIQVWYADKNQPSRSRFKKCINDSQPSIVYLNGMFSYRFVIIPLLTVNKKKIKLVLCPRGMLQRGALAGKSLKKKLFLSALKISGLVKNITWHATNEEEQEDIKRVFGKQVDVIIAGNIPKRPVDTINVSRKVAGQLRLVFLSLIAEKKNLLQTIEFLSKVQGNITLDIYGPVKDERYWRSCLIAIEKNSGKVNYKGDVKPEMVQEIFCQYDASILLTKGENFGHALYESLSVGRPIITSYFTPWNNLEEKKAGWNMDISNEEQCIEKLDTIAGMDADSFDEYCRGAYGVAKEYYEKSADISNYQKLFSVD